MKFIDPVQIKEYCFEALETAENHGVTEALDFLIGEKLFRLFRELKKNQNKVQFVYGAESMNVPEAGNMDPKTYQLNYQFTINETYRKHLANIRVLEKILDQFIHEIKDTFELNDIRDYLDSYPRMGGKPDSPLGEPGGAEKVSSFSKEDVLAEVDDILTAEDMKKLFL